ncbi:MAG: hypothetical protein LBL25_05225, partial [Oscillospiraceae bacterium]|nr:hypothetical protein [Oscillospiraceae bacterium]
MKKVLALVMVIFMLAAMTNFALAAPEYVGEVTVQIPGFDFELTLSDAASKYSPAVDAGYGMMVTIAGKPGSTLTFSKDVSFGSMGVDGAATATAGEPISIDTVDGYYIYTADMSQFVIFVTEANAAGQYNEAGLTNDISEISTAGGATGAPADTAPDDAPPAGGESALPAELASAYPAGVWPMAAGQYDPSLDGQGIPDGANVFGLYDSSFTTMLDAPAAIEGYTAVTAAADLAPGSYYVLIGGAGFNYVIIVGIDGPITAAPPPPPAAPDDAPPVEAPPVVEAPVVAAAEVYITIVNNGVVEVAAQPIVPGEMTIEGVLLTAHEKWYKDGVSGYAAGVDATYNMYLIESAWGVTGVPFISQGEAMMGSTPVNVAAVAPGDNIIMTTTGAAMAVTLTATAGET